MDRRHFIRRTALGSLALRGVAATAAEASGNPPAGPTPAVLRRLENRFLAVVVFADGSASIEDKTRGVTWAMGPVALQDKSEIEVGEVWLRGERGIAEQYPGRFAGEASGDHLRFTLLARQGHPVGRFVCDVALDEDELVYRVLEVDDTVPSLAFPPPIESDAVVLPSGLGRILRQAESGTIFPRHLHTFFTQLNMRWVGGLRGDAGWIAIFDEGFEDAFALLASRSVSPGFLRTLGKWRHPYSVRYAFTGGGHVGLAKTYRRWFQKKGLFVSLDQKLERNPRLRSFLGGRAFWLDLARPRQQRRTAEELLVPTERRTNDESLDVHFRYADVKALLGQMKAAGLTRGFLKIAGWIDGGYDWSHPDVWPPPPALGALAELRELLQGDGDLLAGLHDNNQDMYEHTPSFPNGVNRLASGELMTGGIWAGGQAYILRSDASLAYARRNWEKIRTLDPKAMFVDIVTAMQLYQSYEPGHLRTKADDLRRKLELMAFYKGEGVLFGSEEAADFAIPHVDWFENRHRRVPGESIPLWPLVFHDAAFCTRYGGVTGGSAYPGWLEDMLWGYLPHFRITPGWKPEGVFSDTFHVDRWHAAIGLTEMVDHRFRTDDWSVEETRFGNGRGIVCNFSPEPRTIDGEVVPARGYRLLG